MALERFDAAVTTPPRGLVAFLGRAALHRPLGEHLRAAHSPPLASVGLADPADADRAFPAKAAAGAGSGAAPGPGPAATGILRAGWFAKHRQHRPAVALVLLGWEDVAGDPGAWARTGEALGRVKAAAGRRKARVAVAVAAPEGQPGRELPEDRAQALRQQLELDSRALVTFSLADEPSLKRLGRLLNELAITYYRDKAQKYRIKLSDRGPTQGPLLSCRWCLKIGAMAEFCQDWGAAQNFYKAAYLYVEKILPHAFTDSLSSYKEAADVAEVLQLKLGMLALHQQGIAMMNAPTVASLHGLQDAIAQFQAHIKHFKGVPQVLAPELSMQALHMGYVARQYLIFGQLIRERLPKAARPESPLTQPAYYFECASSYAIKERITYEASRTSAASPRGVEGVRPGPYVGQLVKEVDGRAQYLTEDEMRRSLGAAEGQENHSQKVIDTLQLLRAELRPGRSGRRELRLQSLMAEEYMRKGDTREAQRLLLETADMYRQEGWENLLGAAAIKLRKCAQSLRAMRDLLVHSFEICALRGAFDEDERRAILQSAMALIQGQLKASQDESGAVPDFRFQVAPGGALSSCFSCAAGFVVPRRRAATPGRPDSLRQATPGHPVEFVVALQSRAPLPLAVQRVEARFTDPACDTTLHGAAGGGGPGPVGGGLAPLAVPGGGGGPFSLAPGKWLKVPMQVVPKRLGQLQCTEVTVAIGPDATLTFNLQADAEEGPASDMAIGVGVAFGAGSKPFSDSSNVDTDRKGIVVEEEALSAKMSMEVAEAVYCDAYTPVTIRIEAPGCSVRGGALQISCEEPRSAAPAADGSGPGSHAEPVQVFQRDGAAGMREVAGPLAVGDMDPGDARVVECYVRFVDEAETVVFARLTCKKDSEGGDGSARACLDASVTVSSQRALAFSYTFFSAHGKHPLLVPGLGKKGSALNLNTGLDVRESVLLPRDEPCTLLLNAASHAAADITVLAVAVEGAEGVRVSAPAGPGALPVDLATGDQLSHVCTVRCPAEGELASVGRVAVEWRARGAGALPCVTTFRFPRGRVVAPLLVAECSAAASTVVGQDFQYVVTIRSQMAALEVLRVKVVDDPAFVFSGPRVAEVSLLPGATAEVRWTLVAVTPGQMSLPEIVLKTSPRVGAGVRLTRKGENGIFIHPSKPAAKGKGAGGAAALATAAPGTPPAGAAPPASPSTPSTGSLLDM